jgi:hypothetical protein
MNHFPTPRPHAVRYNVMSYMIDNPDNLSYSDRIKKCMANHNICQATIYNWLNRYRELGHYNTLYSNHGRPHIMRDDHVEFLLDYLIHENCKLYGKEMVSLLRDHFNVEYTLNQVYNTLKLNKFSHKMSNYKQRREMNQ